MARILVLRSKIPFQGPEFSAPVRELIRELRGEGHEVDSLELPQHPEATHHSVEIELWRSFDLSTVCGTTVDLVIATCPHSFEVSHPNKVLWTPGSTTRTWNLNGGNLNGG